MPFKLNAKENEHHAEQHSCRQARHHRRQPRLLPIALSQARRAAIVKAYGEGLYECPVTVENEKDALKAVEDVRAAGCNALVVFLGNFGPETPETLIAQRFEGPCMYVAAAEGDGDMINGRGDAYCGLLNCSYNLGMRHLSAYIPEAPVGTAEETAQRIRDTKAAGHRVIAVGTTSCRTLEAVAAKYGEIRACSGNTSIFLYPGVKFNCIDGLVTNFHLPESTLIMLIAALYGYDKTMHAYKVAVEEKYRFFSFGDAMLIL